MILSKRLYQKKTQLVSFTKKLTWTLFTLLKVKFGGDKSFRKFSPEISDFKVEKNTIGIRADVENKYSHCNNCQECSNRCYVSAIKIKNSKFLIDFSLCTMCLDCIKVCPEDYLFLESRDLITLKREDLIVDLLKA